MAETNSERRRRHSTENEVIVDTVKEMFPAVPDAQVQAAAEETAAGDEDHIRSRFQATVRKVLRR